MQAKSYTGVNGFYAEVSPNDQSLDILRKWFGRRYPDRVVPLNYDQDIGLHCTVIYSLASLKVSPAQAVALVNDTGLYGAKASKFDYWDGHDNEGYLVLKLDSASLLRRHQMWRNCGAVPTFEDYQPHITLATGTSAQAWKPQLDALNKALESAPMQFVLTGETITDLKKD